MTFQEAAKKTGVAYRMDKGLKIYRDKHGSWSIKGTLDNINEAYTDWEPVEVSAEVQLIDDHILELLKETKQKLDELIKLTEKYI